MRILGHPAAWTLIFLDVCCNAQTRRDGLTQAVAFAANPLCKHVESNADIHKHPASRHLPLRIHKQVNCSGSRHGETTHVVGVPG